MATVPGEDGWAHIAGSSPVAAPGTGTERRARLARIFVPGDRAEARTLDGFGFGDVSLIKIDVEGHEVEVLRGGGADDTGVAAHAHHGAALLASGCSRGHAGAVGLLAAARARRLVDLPREPRSAVQLGDRRLRRHGAAYCHMRRMRAAMSRLGPAAGSVARSASGTCAIARRSKRSRTASGRKRLRGA